MSNSLSAPAFSRLTARDYKTLWLAILGGVLEFYDFIIFVFFANTIGDLFFPPGIPDWVRQFQTFGIFAAGYLARPLGGVVMAHAGDLHGRKKMFTLSVFLMALPTLGIGLLPTYASLGAWAPVLLLLLRILQGLARPTRGRILVGGKPVTGPGRDRSLVFQSPSLFPWRDVYGNVIQRIIA